MSDHTPGPWHVDPDPRVDGADQVCEANGNTVAFVATGREREEHEDNARLIAAAPQLLAACEAAESFLTTGGYQPNHYGGNVLVALRAAIAQARGQ